MILRVTVTVLQAWRTPTVRRLKARQPAFFTSIASQIERGEELMVEETGRTLSGRFWMAI